MSLTLKINEVSVLTFDLDTNDILTPSLNSPVSKISELSTLNTQKQLCTTTQCYNCTEKQCNNVQCSTQQCNQVQCTQVKCNQVKCYTTQCDCSNCNWCSYDGGRDA